MLGRKALIPVFLAGLFAISIFGAGCGGHDSFFPDEQPTPLSSDVIIIGDSTAALVAALEASRNGASVLVYYNQPEEDSWLFNEGLIAVVEDEEDSEAPAAAELRGLLEKYGGGSGAGWHFERLVENAAADLAWLSRETDLEMSRKSPFHFIPENLSSSQFYERLKNAALNEGVRFLEETTVLELMIDEQKKTITGIKFMGKTETVCEAYARAVILADGGILGHEGLMKELAPAVTIASWRRGQAAMGWQVAMKAGLDLVEANLFAYAPAFERNGTWFEAIWPEGALLIVGEEIIPLSGPAEEEVMPLLAGAPRQSGYLLVAESQLGPEVHLDWPRYEGLDAFMEAHRLDLPLLRRYYLQPWVTFYGLPVKAVAEYCLGGIAVNASGEVLRGGEPVKGLFAAGEITGGLHGWSLMSGAAFSEALVWGRLVGRSAAELALR